MAHALASLTCASSILVGVVTERAAMKETRKQKIDRRARYAAERVMRPIREAIDRGELVIRPAAGEIDPRNGLEFCPRCSSGPRGREDVEECPDCGYKWAGPRLLDSVEQREQP